MCYDRCTCATHVWGKDLHHVSAPCHDVNTVLVIQCFSDRNMLFRFFSHMNTANSYNILHQTHTQTQTGTHAVKSPKQTSLQAM